MASVNCMTGLSCGNCTCEHVIKTNLLPLIPQNFVHIGWFSTSQFTFKANIQCQHRERCVIYATKLKIGCQGDRWTFGMSDLKVLDFTVLTVLDQQLMSPFLGIQNWQILSLSADDCTTFTKSNANGFTCMSTVPVRVQLREFECFNTCLATEKPAI